MIFGLLSLLGFFICLLPLLGALNWLNIPFAVIGLVISIIALTTAKDEPRGQSIAGLIMCLVAILFGMLRLMLGGGVL